MEHKSDKILQTTQLQQQVKIIRANITTIPVDAIVNAANTTLLGGGGVDGAIHKAAGPELVNECKSLNGCNTGFAKYTKAYNLPAKFVIHTVGPVWRGGMHNEHAMLTSCYKNIFLIAKQLKVQTLSIPAISTGVYRFPKDEAVIIAHTETILALKENNLLKNVIFVIFDDENYRVYIKQFGF